MNFVMFAMWVLVGLLAGYLAGVVMKRGGYGLSSDIILGLVGSIVVSGIFWTLEGAQRADVVAVATVAFIGAAIPIVAQRKIWPLSPTRRSRRSSRPFDPFIRRCLMQWQAPWLKPAVWGVIGGAVATMIVGFSWMGWVLGGTAERMAVERANTAVIVALTPSCVASFMQQPDAAAKLAEFRAIDTWKQPQFVEDGGWATPRGEKTPNEGVANACAEQLAKAKT